MQAALADAQYQLAVQDLTARIRPTSTCSAPRMLAAAQALNEANTQQLALAKKSFEVGTVTITDVHEAQSRADLSSAQVIAAEARPGRQAPCAAGAHRQGARLLKGLRKASP
jgi:outer membrane protein